MTSSSLFIFVLICLASSSAISTNSIQNVTNNIVDIIIQYGPDIEHANDITTISITSKEFIENIKKHVSIGLDFFYNSSSLLKLGTMTKTASDIIWTTSDNKFLASMSSKILPCLILIQWTSVMYLIIDIDTQYYNILSFQKRLKWIFVDHIQPILETSVVDDDITALGRDNKHAYIANSQLSELRNDIERQMNDLKAKITLGVVVSFVGSYLTFGLENGFLRFASGAGVVASVGVTGLLYYELRQCNCIWIDMQQKISVAQENMKT